MSLIDMTTESILEENKKLCECGCGEIIPAFTFYDKHSTKIPIIRRFKSGHNRPFQRGEKNISWKGGRIMSSKGYVLIYSPNHPFRTYRGYVSEHRLVMEKHLGRYLDPNEDIHHINGIKTDNRVENLQVLEHGKHSTLHHYIHSLRKLNIL